MNLVDMILGTVILAGIVGALIFRFGIYPMGKRPFLEFKDFLREKWNEVKFRKRKR